MTKTSEFTLYGKGVFTTLAILDDVPFLWDKHWLRISENATRIGMDISSIDENLVRSEFNEKVSTAGQLVGKARITLAATRTSSTWSEQLEDGISVSILAASRPAANKKALGVSPYLTNSRSPLAGIKSCNYLEPIMSLDEAKTRGFHEAVRVNERGFVTSACMANVFWVKGGELFTPGLATGCLAGTTREFVLENIDCREVEVGIEVLDDAEAIFLTSAGIGVVRVVAFEGRRLETVDHPILHLLPY